MCNERNSMIAVDRFMDMNGQQLSYMTRTEYAPNPVRWSRFHVPAMTFDEAADFCGYSDDKEMDRSHAIILPSGSSDKLRERAQVGYHMRRHSCSVWIERECPCDAPYKLHHHPDYSDLDRTWLVCRKCHGKIHSEINRQNKATVILMIAVKMFTARRIAAVVPPSADSREAVTLPDRGTICVTLELDRTTGGIEDDPTPFEEDSSDSDIPEAIGGSCTPFMVPGHFHQLQLF